MSPCPPRIVGTPLKSKFPSSSHGPGLPAGRSEGAVSGRPHSPRSAQFPQKGHWACALRARSSTERTKSSAKPITFLDGGPPKAGQISAFSFKKKIIYF